MKLNSIVWLISLINCVSSAAFNSDQESQPTFNSSPDLAQSHHSKSNSSSPVIIFSDEWIARKSLDLKNSNRDETKYLTQDDIFKHDFDSENEELSSIDSQAAIYGRLSSDYDGDSEDSGLLNQFCPIKSENHYKAFILQDKPDLQIITAPSETISRTSSRSTTDSSPNAQSSRAAGFLRYLRQFRLLPIIWENRKSLFAALVLAFVIQCFLLPN